MNDLVLTLFKVTHVSMADLISPVFINAATA
jgi:hypothetical protein